MYYNGANWVWDKSMIDYLRNIPGWYWDRSTSDKKEDGVKWCEHWNGGEYFKKQQKQGVMFIPVKDCDFCPYCGQPRPAEKRKLAEVAWHAFDEDRADSSFEKWPYKEGWEKVAKTIIEKVCEEIDAYSEHRTTPNSGAGIFARGLKQHLKDELL
jgi:hypothetical protein